MSQTLEMVLRKTGTLTPDELAVSLGQAKARKLKLWDFLVLERQVPEDTLAEAFSQSLKVPRVSIDSRRPSKPPRSKRWPDGSRKHNCLPIRFTGKTLVLAMANPLDQQAIQDVQFASSRQYRARGRVPQRHPERHREVLLVRRPGGGGRAGSDRRGLRAVACRTRRS